jgi:hypothetical protein
VGAPLAIALVHGGHGASIIAQICRWQAAATAVRVYIGDGGDAAPPPAGGDDGGEGSADEGGWFGAVVRSVSHAPPEEGADGGAGGAGAAAAALEGEAAQREGEEVRGRMRV